uniref:Capsid protein n=1 Tax=Soybean thrips permutotetra-like virus 2 TaxID=2801046 RepID=A0A7T8IML8_9VIRU|nr:capsid protein precursor [Soybean thrips permutotetra-like virus 2]
MVSKSKRRRLAAEKAAKQNAGAQAPVARPNSAPKRRRNTQARTARSGGNRVVSGTDLLTTTFIRSGVKSGALVAQVRLGPSVPETRLYQEATLFSKWRPRNLRVRVVLDGNRNCTGQLLVGWVADTNWIVSGTTSNLVRAVAAQRPSKLVMPGQSGVLNIPTAMDTNWYACNGATHNDTFHGIITIAACSSFGGFTGDITVNCYLDWTVQFSGSEMQIVSLVPSATITPDAGWKDIFTTSDGSFDGDRLTFKMHQGLGDMVPFTAAMYGVVYGPDKGTVVKYYQENGALATCNYFSKVKSYVTPGLVCHADYQSAIDYQNSGDLSKILTYKTAGPYVTPSVPVFKVVTSVFEPGPSEGARAITPVERNDVAAALDRLTSVINSLDSRLRLLEMGSAASGASAFEEIPPATEPKGGD